MEFKLKRKQQQCAIIIIIKIIIKKVINYLLLEFSIVIIFEFFEEVRINKWIVF